MTPFECYKTFLAMKVHFTKDSYDYIRYNNTKIKAKPESYYGDGKKRKPRRDRIFFEKISRQYSDKEIERFYVANFADVIDSQNIWPSNMVKYGEKNYIEWQKKMQALQYTFKEESTKLLEGKNIDDIFKCKTGGHPPILKSFMRGEVSLETMVVYDVILGYRVNFDKQMKDPVWKSYSMKIKKYSPFINIDVFRYRKILKDIVVDSTT